MISASLRLFHDAGLQTVDPGSSIEDGKFELVEGVKDEEDEDGVNVESSDYVMVTEKDGSVVSQGNSSPVTSEDRTDEDRTDVRDLLRIRPDDPTIPPQGDRFVQLTAFRHAPTLRRGERQPLHTGRPLFWNFFKADPDNDAVLDTDLEDYFGFYRYGCPVSLPDLTQIDPDHKGNRMRALALVLVSFGPIFLEFSDGRKVPVDLLTHDVTAALYLSEKSMKNLKSIQFIPELAQRYRSAERLSKEIHYMRMPEALRQMVRAALCAQKEFESK